MNIKKNAASKVILLHCDTVVIINARKSSTGLNLTITNGPWGLRMLFFPPKSRYKLIRVHSILFVITSVDYSLAFLKMFFFGENTFFHNRHILSTLLKVNESQMKKTCILALIFEQNPAQDLNCNGYFLITWLPGWS